MPEGQRAGADPSIGDLVQDLTEQTSRLLRDEVALATAELKASAKHGGIGVGLFGGAGFLAVLGVITLVGSAVAALSLAMDVWLAALIVGVVLLALAAVAGLLGTKQVKEVGPPQRTVENVKKDVATVKGHHA